VIFGPNYQKFREARELLVLGGAFAIQDLGELSVILEQLMHNPEKYNRSAKIAGQYVLDNTGATNIILNNLFTEIPMHPERQ